MSIIDSIQSARKNGASDEQILNEMGKQNPQKMKVFQEARRRGAAATEILDEIIRRNSAKEEDLRLKEAQKRIESLRQKTQKVNVPQSPAPEIKPSLPSPVLAPRPPVNLPIGKSTEKETIRPLPRKPTLREKLWIRVLVFSVVLVFFSGLATFWYWFFVIKTQPPILPPPIGGPTNGPGQTPSPSSAPSEIPPSLITVDSTRVLTVANSEELRKELSQALLETQDPNQFKRIVIKDAKDNKTVGLKGFFEALLVRAPGEIFDNTENDFTLFVYSQNEGNRLGLVVKTINKEKVIDILGAQEPAFEDNFQTFFSLMGYQKPPVSGFFTDSEIVPGYTGPNFRYQTLSRNDLGIVYLITDKYTTLTSSFTSMRQTIDKLAVEVPETNLTAELKYGDVGYQVRLVQMWFTEDGAYPKGLVTGWFGPLTQQALIRFQEKYSADVLAPRGLTRGTGIADDLTRQKLNGLFGKSGIRPRLIQITRYLQLKDRGDEVVLLQKWLSQDRKIYPSGIISGNYGPLTQQAVALFQEKYSSEILSPQGLSRGTGIVDSLTRKKLNELYGEKAF